MKNYFAVLGKTPQLSLVELASIDPISVERKGQLVFFDIKETADEQAMATLLDDLGGIVKWGTVYNDLGSLVDEIAGSKIIAVNTRELGMTLKKEYGVKRFKEVTLESANLEVKKEGIEILELGSGKLGIVQGWQNIDRFACIDFDKPARGMQIGMMPAKLTQIMVNLGVLSVYNRTKQLSSIKKSEEGSEESRSDGSDDNFLTGKIIGCALDIHTKYKDTLTEKQYQNMLVDKLLEKGLNAQKEVVLPIIENGKKYGQRYIDLVVNDKVAIELKKTTHPHEIKKGYRQIRNYLDLGNYVVGLFLNFATPKLSIQRFNHDYHQSSSDDSSDFITIWDPFCGFGTTGFVANSLGYHFIGSDINITPAKQNQKRRPSTPYYTDERHFTLFKQDVLDPFTKPFLQAVDVIVTEGWLGPIVKNYNPDNKGQETLLLKNIEEIVTVYRGFLKNTKDAFPQILIIMTVPVYSWMGAAIEQRITHFAEDIGYQVEQVGEVYQRKNQLVGRRILSLK